MNDSPWFVRRTFGYGWRPASWQGWLITIAAVAVVVTSIVLTRIAKSPLGIVVVIAVAAVYVSIAAATARHPASSPSAFDSEPTGTADDDGASSAVSPAPVAMPIRARAPGASHEPALLVEGLTKRFGERIAFQDVSFSVGAGEVFGFLGPNGAGKTTTVRTLGTLIAPTAGSATVAGVPLLPDNGEAIRQRIAIMPEAPGLYLRLSVRENLEFFAGLFGVTDARNRIRQVLAAVNLLPRSEDLCGSLSKGLRQRAALARALLNDPDILFLDEPTSGLDPVATREVHTLIDGLRRRGVTVFLTTHRLEEAERLCDRVAILNTTLRMVGSPDELRTKLFSRSLLITTAAPISDPDAVFDAVSGVEHWSRNGDGQYVLEVANPKDVSPAVTRALVAAGADVQSIAEVQHSLEDVYLELISDDVEAQRR